MHLHIPVYIALCSRSQSESFLSLFVFDLFVVDQFVCTTSAIADIVILVDGSWSIGRLNFRLVRTFLESLVNAFDVGIDKTRIGMLCFAVLPLNHPDFDQQYVVVYF